MKDRFRNTRTKGLPIAADNAQKRIARILFPVFVLAVFCVLGMRWLLVEAESAETGNSKRQISVWTDFRCLEGRWVRPDGGYVLELHNIQKDGSVTATYFNPQPIKVFRAKVSRKHGRVNLFVELRDINYPGSTYNLQYDTATDQLKGTYFQAVQKLTFDIEFERVK